MTGRKISANVVVLSFIMSVLVFIADLIVPLGVAMGVLYVCCIVVLVNQPKKAIIAACVANSVLILIVVFFTTTNTTSWMAFTNRGISILCLWIAGYIAARHTALAKERKAHIFKLKKKNRELEQFTYVASHDLQEPLRTINSFTELMEEQYRGKLDDTADRYLAYIAQASTRMSALVKSLLDYSRIGRKRELTTVDCNEQLEAVQKDLEVSIVESNATFELGKLPQIKAYETELRLLFQNLISNAIKFRKPNTTPHITITAKKDNGWTFAVQDNGIGIAENHKEKIFAIFQRLHSKSAYEGTGIGLAHCRKILELHDGEIWVDSQPNEGSTFYFSIPNHSL